jgi:hypothetical protein
LIFEDLFDPVVTFCRSEPVDSVFVYPSFGAEPFELGELLELLDEAFEAVLLVEIAGNRFHVRPGVGFDGGGERAAEDARKRHRFGGP